LDEIKDAAGSSSYTSDRGQGYGYSDCYMSTHSKQLVSNAETQTTLTLGNDMDIDLASKGRNRMPSRY